MANIVAPYAPNKRQVITCASGDIVFIPTYGLPLNVIVESTGGAMSSLVARHHPAVADDITQSIPMPVSNGQAPFDAYSKLATAQSLVPGGAAVLIFPGGQGAYSFMPTGTAARFTWTLYRAKTDPPDFQP